MNQNQTILFKQVEELEKRANILGEKPLESILNTIKGSMLCEDTHQLMNHCGIYSEQMICRIKEAQTLKN